MTIQEELSQIAKDNPGAANFINTLMPGIDFYGKGKHRLAFNVGASVKMKTTTADAVMQLAKDLAAMSEIVSDGLENL